MKVFLSLLLTPWLARPLSLPNSRARRSSFTLSASPVSFDVDLAVALGAHAFDTYNDPTLGSGKQCFGEDGTLVTFHSSEFVQMAFGGVVIGTLSNGSFRGVEETSLLESTLTGKQPDPYVKITVNAGKADERVIDVFSSKVVENTVEPSWMQSFSLYCKDGPEDTVLTVEAYDRDMLSSDDCIGVGEVRVRDLLQLQEENKAARGLSKLPVPLYVDAPKGWFGLGGGRRRSGTVNLELQFVSFTDTRSPLRKDSGPKISGTVPKGATPGEADWEAVVSSRVRESIAALSGDAASPRETTLAQRLLCSMGSGLHKICSIDNIHTDTQAALWTDFRSKNLVLSFRGTEQIKVKDVLTDINLVQTHFFPGHQTRVECANEESRKLCNQLGEVLCHKGFLTAYRSIEPAILQLLFMIMASCDSDDECGVDDWTIYITGHSLGGALASLTTFDLARIAQECYQKASSDTAGSRKAQTMFVEESWVDPGSSLLLERSEGSERFLRALQRAEIVTYTYGAPRVGNVMFSKLSDSLAPHAYRIVNQADVVPRVPRSSASNRVLEYSHAGRTVAIVTAMEDVEPSAPHDISVWIEGQDGGVSPTQEVSPFEFDAASGGLPSDLFTVGKQEAERRKIQELRQEDPVFDIEEQVASLLALHPGASSAALASLGEKALKQGQGMLLSQLPSVLEAAGIGKKEMEKLDGLYKTAASVGGGLQKKFVERELSLLASILDQRAIVHHLEPSYFRSLTAMIEAKVREESETNKS